MDSHDAESALVASFLQEYMRSDEELQQAPLLTAKTVESIGSGAVCRYYGMVQDQLQPEFVIGSFTKPDGGTHTTKLADMLTDRLQGLEFADAEKMFTAKPYFCISLPGQSDWLQGSVPQSTPVLSAGLNTSKRARMDDDDTAEMAHASTNEARSCGSKHQRVPVSAPSPDGTVTRTRKADQVMLPGNRGCIVNVYHPDVELKLHDVVEVFGVFSLSPDLATLHFDAMNLGADMHSADYLASHPPSSLVTTLHCLQMRKIAPYEICRELPAPDMTQRSAALRAQAIDVLAAPLGGDMLAAEYLLLQLVSRVHARAASKPLGTLSLSLQNCPEAAAHVPGTAASEGSSTETGAAAKQMALSQFGAAVKKAIAKLVPACVALPLTVNMLNSGSFRPHRDSKDRLVPAELQMAAHTQLLLDATLMKADQLNTVGCANYEALTMLMEQQQVTYDFTVYSLPMPVDVPVTILSVGRSLLHAAVDLELPLNAAGIGSKSAGVSHEALPAIRAYLHQAQQHNFSINEDSSPWLEQELLDSRQEQGSLSTSFHKQLTLARLMAVSWGEATLSKGRWHQMKAVERARQNRLKAVRPASKQAPEKVVAAYCG